MESLLTCDSTWFFRLSDCKICLSFVVTKPLHYFDSDSVKLTNVLFGYFWLTVLTVFCLCVKIIVPISDRNNGPTTRYLTLKTFKNQFHPPFELRQNCSLVLHLVISLKTPGKQAVSGSDPIALLSNNLPWSGPTVTTLLTLQQPPNVA